MKKKRKRQRELLAQAPVRYLHPTETIKYKREKRKAAQVPKTPRTKVTLRLILQQLRILVCSYISFDVIVLENIQALVENTDALLELKKKKAQDRAE